MNQDDILNLMRAYFKNEKPDIDVSSLNSVRVTDTLSASIDIVEFLIYLEEELGLEDQIDLDRLGPKITQNLTFADLAREIERFLEPSDSKA